LAVASIGGSLALLLLRLRLTPAPEPARSLLLAATLGAVLAASSALPSLPGRPRRWGTVVGTSLVGTAAVGLVWTLRGPSAAVPWAATALPLGVLAAFAEEALFRGSLYDRLAHRGAVLAVVATAVAFALFHVPAYGWVAFPVDLGAGLLFGWQRHASGTWVVPASTHALANVAAMVP
jgi:membrane protease YdiL (CAAX protease family)